MHIYRFMSRDREIWCSTVAKKFSREVTASVRNAIWINRQPSPANTDHPLAITQRPYAFRPPVRMWATHLTSPTKLTWLPARKQTGLSSTSRLAFPVLQANLGVSLMTPERTSNVHTALLIDKQGRLWCKSTCSKTDFPSPVSLSGKTPPQPSAGLQGTRGGTDRRNRAVHLADDAPAPGRATPSPDPLSDTVSWPAGRHLPGGRGSPPAGGRRMPATSPVPARSAAGERGLGEHLPLLTCLNTEPPWEESSLWKYLWPTLFRS